MLKATQILILTFKINLAPKHSRQVLSGALPLFTQIVVGAEVMRKRRVRRVVQVASVGVAQVAIEVLLAQVPVQLVRVHEPLLAELAEWMAPGGRYKD